MTPDVEEAIEEIKEHFRGHTVLVGPDKDGGACVIIEDVALGAPYAQPDTWLGFHITHGCPYADVYPHFVRGDIQRRDGHALGEALTNQGHVFPQQGVVVGENLPPRHAAQISRRSNKRDTGSSLETPLLKAMKVLRWLMSR